MSPFPARRRYQTSVLLLSAGYALLLLAVTAWFRHGSPTGAVAYLAAILPALPIVGVFVVLGRYIVEERDEYQRLLLIRQALVATGFALSVATVWGFLESFDLVTHVPAYAVAILWFGGLGLGSCWNKLAERGEQA